LLAFITSPVLTAAFVISVPTYSGAVTARPTTSTPSAYYSAVHSTAPRLKPLSVPDASVNCPWIFTFPFESCNVLFFKFTNFCGIPNSFKISYQFYKGLLYQFSWQSDKRFSRRC